MAGTNERIPWDGFTTYVGDSPPIGFIYTLANSVLWMVVPLALRFSAVPLPAVHSSRALPIRTWATHQLAAFLSEKLELSRCLGRA